MDVSYHSASLNMTPDFSKKAALVIVSNVIEREFNCVNCVKSVWVCVFCVCACVLCEEENHRERS